MATRTRRTTTPSFIKSTDLAAGDSTNVTAAVLAQVPADYPGDTHVFVHSNQQLLSADIALAHAYYDISVIGLASGGYLGS